jgi:hypothetical protein
MKETDDRPRLLVRIEISGAHFPHRAPEPLVKIVSEGQTIARWFADVSADNRRLVIDLPREGMLELGYGSEVLGRVPVKFESEAMNRLDRERLPEDVIVVSTESLETKR